MKKIINYIVSLILSVLIALIFYELMLHIVPVVYRNLPQSADKIYVYIVGESTAFGIPYQGKLSYSKIMQYMLDNKIDGKQIELRNLAKGGDTLSDQYKKYMIYKYLHPFQKGIVLLYTGTNNWTNKPSNYDFKWERKLDLVALFKSYLTYKQKHDFKYEYERIILLTKRFGDDAYISTIAGNYAGFMPNNVSALINNKILNDNIDTIDILTVQGQYDIAMERSNKLLDLNEDKAQIWYRIGKIYEKQNNIQKANEAYLNAIEYGWDARPTRYQNNVILKLANKYNIEVSDIFNKLINLNEIIGYNFFMDRIHPTIRLNTMIAEGFVEILSKKYKINIVNTDLSQKAVCKGCNFSQRDLFLSYVEGAREIFMYSYIDTIAYKYNFEVAKQYIEYMKTLDLDKQEKDLYINLYTMLYEYRNGNTDKAVKILYDNKLKDKFVKGNIPYWNRVFDQWMKEISDFSKNRGS